MKVLQLRIPPLPRYAVAARSALSIFAGENRLAAADLENLVFALGEAIANAIQHARTAEAIEVRIRADGDCVIVTVTDRGQGFASPPRGPIPLPHAFAEVGRGFAIMQRCTDFLEVQSDPGAGTVVTLGRRRRDSQELGTAS
jgi:stage II sporulation protein AB (anti-sigma F factor)